MQSGLAKATYHFLFLGLVDRLNASWASGDATTSSDRGCVSLLDIFGFETCSTNSLEQLCINFANEKLQNHYMKHMVEAERQLFEKEGLSLDLAAMEDNSGCLDLMAGRLSIFSLLNEDSR